MERLARRSESSATDLLASILGAAQGTSGTQGTQSTSGTLLVPEGRPRAASTGGELAVMSPLLLGAGRLLMDNRETILQVLGSRGGPVATGGLAAAGSAAVLPWAVGAAITSGVAKLGLNLLERRLQRSRAEAARGVKPDPLRGVSARSRIERRRNRKVSGSSCGSAPLQQLATLFPHLERAALAATLASHDGDLEAAIDTILAESSNLSTPATNPSFTFPSSSSPTSSAAPTSTSAAPSSPLPPCPDCPVCFAALAGRRIFQCSQGHSLCQECRDQPQVVCCPTCRGRFVGRATNMEQLLANIYGTR